MVNSYPFQKKEKEVYGLDEIYLISRRGKGKGKEICVVYLPLKNGVKTVSPVKITKEMMAMYPHFCFKV